MKAINEVKMLAAKKGVTLTYLADYLSKNTELKSYQEQLIYNMKCMIDDQEYSFQISFYCS